MAHCLRVLTLNAAIAAVLLASLGGARPVAAQSMPPEPATTVIAQNPTPGQVADLRMHLHHLLSEHTVLAGITTQKAAMGAPDFDAAFRHLDQNSVMLSDLVGSVYGPQAAAQVLPLWRAHTQMYVDYTVASARRDFMAREQVRGALGQWIDAQAAQFAMLNPNLTPDTMASQLTVHVDGTLAAIDTFGEGAFDEHYDIMHQAFEHSFMMGDVLAMAIAFQFPDRFALQMPMSPAAR